jgi:guanylate kinase
MKDFPDKFGFSVSHTTRQPRPGEINGTHYHFTVNEEMERGIAAGEFIENAFFANNHYGTSKVIPPIILCFFDFFQKAVQQVLDQGKMCILDIDIQGVQSIKRANLSSYFILIAPPSLEELEKRLRGRYNSSNILITAQNLFLQKN